MGKKKDDGRCDKLLCKLAKKGRIKKIGELAKGARFVCAKCGRAAARAGNLCKPVEM